MMPYDLSRQFDVFSKINYKNWDAYKKWVQIHQIYMEKLNGKKLVFLLVNLNLIFERDFFINLDRGKHKNQRIYSNKT